MARVIGELYWNITYGTKIVRPQMLATFNKYGSVRQKTRDELDLEESEREVDEYLRMCSTLTNKRQ